MAFLLLDYVPSLEKVKLWNEFYFFFSFLQYWFEDSYLNYDISRYRIFNWWAEDYLTIKKPATVFFWKARFRRKVPGVHDRLFKYSGTLSWMFFFFKDIGDPYIGQKVGSFNLIGRFWISYFKNYAIFDEWIGRYIFSLNLAKINYINEQKYNFALWLNTRRLIRRFRLGWRIPPPHMHFDKSYLFPRVSYRHLPSQVTNKNLYLWAFINNLKTRIGFSHHKGVFDIFNNIGLVLQNNSVLIRAGSFNYLNYFTIFFSVFPYYQWVFYYQYILAYFFAFLFFCTVCSFKSVLNHSIFELNSEYAWKRFRNIDLLELDWMFKAVNVKVKAYLSNSKFAYSNDYSNKVIDDDAEKFFSTLVYMDKHAEQFDFFGMTHSHMINAPRTKWLVKTSKAIRERGRSRIFDIGFNFGSFHQSERFDDFYNNLVVNHLQIGGFLAYGNSRNKFIRQANFSEAEVLEALPIFFNKRYLDYKYFFDFMKSFFYSLDKQLFNNKLPYWSLHKDSFSYQLGCVQDDLQAFVLDDLVFDEEEQRVYDNRYFLVDEDPHTFYFVTFWVFAVPLFLFLAVYLKNHWFGFFTSRKAIDFFFFGYWSHFDFPRNFTLSISSNYWIGEHSWWRWGSYYSAYKPRNRKKRHLSFRPLMEGLTVVGEYVVWEAKIFVFNHCIVKILYIMRSLFEIFIYFLFTSLLLSAIRVLFFRKFFVNIEKGALFYKYSFIKLFLKVKLYIAFKNYLKDKYFKFYK
jgi:hypothetical protein